MDILKQTETGLYGLTAANGLGEDMFGNELTEEQRQTSLMTALGITGIAGAAKAADKIGSGTKLIPYSKEYVQNKVHKAQGSIKDMGKAIGKVEVPTGVKVRTVADSTGNTYKSIGLDKTPIKDIAQKITAKGGSKSESKNNQAEIKSEKSLIKDFQIKQPKFDESEIPVLKGEMPWGPGNIAKAGKAISKIPGSKMFKDKPSKNLDKVKGNKGINNPKTRLPRSNGHWEGEPGSGKWYSDKQEVKNITNGEGVEFVKQRPNFTPWSEGNLVFENGKLTGTADDFSLVYEKIQQQYNLPSKNAAKKLLKQAGVTPHHKSSTEIELIPTDLHGNVPHIGSASDLRGGY